MPRSSRRSVGETGRAFYEACRAGSFDEFVASIHSHEQVRDMCEVAARMYVENAALTEQMRAIQEEMERGTEVAPVLDVSDRMAIVRRRGGVHRVSLATLHGNGKAGESGNGEVRPGDALVLDKGEAVATEALGRWIWSTDIARITGLLPGGRQALVEAGGRTHVLHLAHGLDGNLKHGSQVLCSLAEGLVQEILPDEEAPVPREVLHSVPAEYGLRGVHPEVRRRVEREVVRPLLHFEACARRGWEGPVLVILSGPTGVGKSFLVDQIAAVTGAALLRRFPSSFRTPWFGRSEGLVRQFGDQIVALARKDIPVIAVLEEADVYLSQRSSVFGSSVARTELAIESEWFALVDRLPCDRPIALILTTNLCHTFEVAVARRMEHRVVRVGYLPPAQVEEVVDYYLPAQERVKGERGELLRRAVDRLCDRSQAMLSATVDGRRRQWAPADLASPSLTATVVRAAANEANGRALEADEDDDDAGRLDWETLATAIHTGLLDWARSMTAQNLGDYLPEVRESRVSEVRVVLPEAPVEAYLAA